MTALKSFLNSFSTSPGGWSGRKLTAVMLAGCIAASHVMWHIYALAYRDFSLFITVNIIDLIGIGFFLGMVTAQQIIELKNGKSEPVKETTAETNTTSDTKGPENIQV